MSEARKTMRELLGQREVKIGTYVSEFLTPSIGYIIKAAGYDFVTFDMEHSGFEFEAMRSALRYAEAAGLATAIRPPSKQYADIARALDIGVDALMVQSVATAQEVQEIVTFMKYPPKGKRGVTVEHYNDRFLPGPTAAKLAAANEATVLIALIETREGIENVEAIAGVEGVDCLYIGHVDLSVDIGLPDEYDHPRMIEAVTRIAKACRLHGKSFAWSVGSIGTLEEMRRLGADVIAYGGDASLLRDALAAGASDIRRRLAAAA
jgi:2-keto-3-deoxy-L-rhamnonate aldolase RhmA